MGFSTSSKEVEAAGGGLSRDRRAPELSKVGGGAGGWQWDSKVGTKQTFRRDASCEGDCFFPKVETFLKSKEKKFILGSHLFGSSF